MSRTFFDSKCTLRDKIQWRKTTYKNDGDDDDKEKEISTKIERRNHNAFKIKCFSSSKVE